MSERSKRQLDFPHSLDTTDPASATGTNYLLAIGIDSYQHMGNLRNCVRDAKAFVAVLTGDYDFDSHHILELYDEQATRAQILSALDQLGDTLTDNDNLIIYYAGHGYYKPANRIGFLVPVDGKATANWSMIFNSTIRDYIRGMPAHHVLLVVDSCFSGDLILRSRGEAVLATGSETYAERVYGKPSRWGLAAGRIEEVADGIAGNHSPFNEALVTFLKTHHAKQFAVSELINHVSKITTYNSDQTPIGGILDKAGHQGGEFVFSRKLDEQSLWQEVADEHSRAAYQRYLSLFPTGRYIDEATWGITELEGSLAAYLEYRRAFPKGKYYEEALEKMEELEEKTEWEAALRRDSLATYERFLENYPSGRYHSEAKSRIEAILAKKRAEAAERKEAQMWQKATQKHTKTSYQHYLSVYPQGKYVSEAEETLEKLQQASTQEKQRQEQARRERELQQQDQEAWEKASRFHTVESYKEYIRSFSQGGYVSETRQQIEQLKQKAEAKKQSDIPQSVPKHNDKFFFSYLWIWNHYRIGIIVGLMVLLLGIWAISKWNRTNFNTERRNISQVAEDTSLIDYEEKSSNNVVNSIDENLQDLIVRSFSNGYVYQDDGKLGLLDLNYQVLLEATYDRIEPFSNGIAIVHLDDKRGYVNDDGQVFIEPQYDLAWNFDSDHEGLAKVRFNKRDFYINKRGEKTSPSSLEGYSDVGKPRDESLSRNQAIQQINSQMVRVAGGTFMMGSENGDSDEKPIHEVALSAYEIGRFEITQAQWEAVMGENPSHFKNCLNCPVEEISWNDVKEFINKLNQYTGGRYRLPTEAEWEYAARGGNQSKGYEYAGSNELDEVGWYWKNSGNKLFEGEWDLGKIKQNDNKTHPVGEKQPNEIGIYDMSGNVGEWCSDWSDYNNDYYATCRDQGTVTDPTGPVTGQYRVIRGGSWRSYASRCRVAYRSNGTPSRRFNDLGFRLSRAVP